MDSIVETCSRENIAIAAFSRGEAVVPICRDYGLDLHALLKQLPIRMPEHAVTLRHVFDFWPQESFDQIWAVQDAHDKGLVDVCTGQASNHFVLYAIPRKRPAVGRRKWFTAVAG